MCWTRTRALLLSVAILLLLPTVPAGVKASPQDGGATAAVIEKNDSASPKQESESPKPAADAKHAEDAKHAKPADAGSDVHGAGQEAGHGAQGHGGEGHYDPTKRATGPESEGHPPGFTGPSTVEAKDADEDGRGIPRPDRWRFGFPEDTRHEHGRKRDPYHQNVLKGDYPIKGNDIFMNLTLDSVSAFFGKRVPSPSSVSAARPGSRDFFGRGEQFAMAHNWRASFSLFKGDTTFQPVNWEIKVTAGFNYNYVHTEEVGLLNVDIRRGKTRGDGHVSLQEAYFEKKLNDNARLFPFLPRKDGQEIGSPNYDFNSVRAGIQRFTSDFRGFIFSDEEPGVRLFGTLGSNRYQYNIAYFEMLEKDTNSGLNTFNWRHQSVYVANLYRQDFLFHGWNANVSFHFNNDRAGKNDDEGGGNFKFDDNGFLVRPAAVGDFTPHNLNVAYLGTSSDGHIGRINVSHAFYWALGHDSHNPIAGRPVHVNAQMAALELSMDRDWLRPKASFFWSSGDANPRDSVARGFDSILDNVNFAGGGGGFLVNPTTTQQDRVLINPPIPIAISFWNRESLRLTGSNVAIQQPGSLVPSLRSSKEQGQANYVNPGIYIATVGADAKLTPKLLTTFNVNYLRFHRPESIQQTIFQQTIRKEIGWDYSAGFQYRPYLNEQWIILGGVSVLVPGQGLKDIYTSPTIYSGFLAVKFAY